MSFMPGREVSMTVCCVCKNGLEQLRFDLRSTFSGRCDLRIHLDTGWRLLLLRLLGIRSNLSAFDGEGVSDAAEAISSQRLTLRPALPENDAFSTLSQDYHRQPSRRSARVRPLMRPQDTAKDLRAA